MTQQEEPWFRRTNVYEVNLRQYTEEGTINAFSAHLPRLKEMGVHTLWFMPLTPIATENRKGSMGSYYACSDYRGVAPEFGTLDDFKALVSTAHQGGFRVILDWVANHTGWNHRWTGEHPDYYKRTETGSFQAAAGMDDIIELDFSNEAMRKDMIAAMQWWVDETGIDGFRCDLAFWVELDFWKEARAVLDPGKKLFWLAELDPLVHPQYMDVFDAAYTWSWMKSAQELYHGQTRFLDLLQLLKDYDTIPGIKAWFTTNHDENSWNGTEYEKYGEAAPALAVFSCTWPGLPLIYSGQEIPNTKRLQFFEKDPLQWPEQMHLLPFYTALLNLHRTHAALGDPFKPAELLLTNEPGKVLAYRRASGGNAIVVVLNMSAAQLSIEFRDGRAEGTYTDLFSGVADHFAGRKVLHLEPWGYRVFVS